jgi:selenocysteine-specific elongation factor
MQVISTAGHAGHGKSTLVRALTGMDPHRAEPQRPSGLAAGLGLAWMNLPSGERLAFVDVPGHERFAATMLAGVGSVPAVLFVVAADRGWEPQSAEHLTLLDALGIRRGLLAVTRADLADPVPALAQAAGRIAASSLGEVRAVAVSAVTGEGLPDLSAALDRLAGSLPAPDAGAPVRVWVDGTYPAADGSPAVTGTLPAGTVRQGDVLVISPSMRPVRVLGIRSLGEPTAELAAPARAAFSLGGVGQEHLGQGMALVHPGRWTLTDVIDVRLPATGPGADPEAPRLPRALTLHAGAARPLARVRQLGSRTARLALREPIPMHVGDRVLLRDPAAGGGQAGWPSVLGAVVLDVSPPPLTRRGAGASAARELAPWPDRPTAADLLRRHGLLRASALLAMGISEHPDPVCGEWLADPGHWADLARRLGDAVAAQAGREPLAPGLTLDSARAALGLPDRRLVEALVRPPLRIRDGVVQMIEPSGSTADAALPAAVTAAVQVLLADLADAPFASPDAGRLRQLGLDVRAIAAAERAGLLLRISDQIVLAPGADAEADRLLAGLPQPFTAAQARQALRTTRRVAIPLLEFLDRAGITERLPDDRRRLRGADPGGRPPQTPPPADPGGRPPQSPQPADPGGRPPQSPQPADPGQCPRRPSASRPAEPGRRPGAWLGRGLA